MNKDNQSLGARLVKIDNNTIIEFYKNNTIIGFINNTRLTHLTLTLLHNILDSPDVNIITPGDAHHLKNMILNTHTLTIHPQVQLDNWVTHNILLDEKALEPRKHEQAQYIMYQGLDENTVNIGEITHTSMLTNLTTINLNMLV